MPYLIDLTTRLAHGVANLPEDLRRRQAGFFLAAQRPDGGFAGRDDQSDLYYTGFALRALALLGELQGPVAERAAEFLRGRLTGRAPIIDFLSLVYSRTLLDMAAGIDIFAAAPPNWPDQVAAALEGFRRDDGGYAKGEEGTASSTYHTFLVAICLELIERPLPFPDRMVQFVLSQRRDDGGFVEIRPMKRSGTNPTAAAVGLLKITGGLDAQARDEVVDFLADMQTDEGGLRANTRIPIADLLSTFTGLLTLIDLGGADEVDREAIERYARSLERDQGGFFAAEWDQACDVEYAFYGLGALAMVAGPGGA
jgi:geranylgeranyl transferase type-2 subunit beta